MLALLPTYYDAALSEGTRATYNTHRAAWNKFCVIFGQDRFAPTQQICTIFIIWLSLSQKYLTVRATMTGVKHAWESDGLDISLKGWHVYEKILRGI